jgi:hypothetical protein
MTTTASVAAPAVAGLTVALFGYGAIADRRGHVRRARNRRCHHPHRSPRSRCGRRRCGWCDRRVLFAAERSAALAAAGRVVRARPRGRGDERVEVFLVRGALGAGPTAFGLVAATLAAGLVGGAVLAARARSQAARAQRVVLAAIVLGCLLVVAGSAPVLWVLAVAWAGLGVGNGVVKVDVSTLLRERTPDSVRGRVLAAVNGMIQRKHARRDGARWCRREPARSADDLRRLRGADGDDQCRVDRAGPPRNGHSPFAGGAGGRRTLRSFGTCTPRSGDARGGIGIRLRPPFQQNA